MIRRPSSYRTEIRENMRGGDGKIQIEHLWEAGKEMLSPNRMFARMTLKPGCSIGFHNHEQEEEVFYIISGDAEVDDNGTKVHLGAGDTILTGNGAGHAIANCGNTALELIAVISKYSK